MITSFKDRRTPAVFHGKILKGFPAELLAVGRRKLGYLHAATSLDDLRSPPGNHLEALKHECRGQHSIRINAQYRICFVWRDGDAEAVEIVDCH